MRYAEDNMYSIKYAVTFPNESYAGNWIFTLRSTMTSDASVSFSQNSSQIVEVLSTFSSSVNTAPFLSQTPSTLLLSQASDPTALIVNKNWISDPEDDLLTTFWLVSPID